MIPTRELAELWKARAIDAVDVARDWRPEIKLPRISAPLSLSLVLFLVTLAILPIYGWHVRSERDAWWAREIREKSGRVTSIIEEGNITIGRKDAQAIRDLEKANAKRLADAEKRASQRRDNPVSQSCGDCRIPADRLWVR